MNDLEVLLRELGDELDVGGDRLADDVVGAIAVGSGPGPAGARHRSGRVDRAGRVVRVAAVVALVVAGLMVVPSSRRAIATWLGLDGVTVERDPDLIVPASVPDEGVVVVEITVPERSAPPADGPADGPDGVSVDRLEGTIDPQVLTKVLGPGSSVREVDVDGHPGLWIDGSPHEVLIRDADGEIVSRSFAGDTLLWQDGERIVRVEGFDDLDDALAFAEALARD